MANKQVLVAIAALGVALLPMAAGAAPAASAPGPAAGNTGRSFPDVPPDHWAAQAVKMLGDLGIVIGYPDGTFGGGKTMTRYEFGAATARVVGVVDKKLGAATAAPAAALPADLAHQSDLQRLYTKPEMDAKLGQLVTNEQLQARLRELARRDDVYSREEMDARFATKDDVQAMAREVQDLGSRLPQH